MIPISYNVRSLTVRKANTIATAVGIALVVFVLAASQMLAKGIERTMASAGRPDNGIVLRKGADGELSSSIESNLVNLVLAAPGVARDANGQPIGVGEVVMVLALDRPGTDGQVANVTLRGVPPEALDFRREVHLVDGRPAKPGTDEVIIGQRLRGQFDGLELGNRFEIKKNRYGEVVGIFEAGGSSFESEVWGDIDMVRSSFGRAGIVSSVTARLESIGKLDAFAANVAGDKQLGLEAMRESDYYVKQSEDTAMLISGLGGGMVFFFSLGAMIGAMITMYGAVTHRRREIGTLRALGFPRLTILMSFLLESFVLALVGGVVGAVAALGMGAVKFSMVNGATWSEVVFSFDPSLTILFGSSIAGGLMGILGGFLPALRAARTSPVEAMRE